MISAGQWVFYRKDINGLSSWLPKPRGWRLKKDQAKKSEQNFWRVEEQSGKWHSGKPLGNMFQEIDSQLTQILLRGQVRWESQTGLNLVTWNQLWPWQGLSWWSNEIESLIGPDEGETCGGGTGEGIAD